MHKSEKVFCLNIKGDSTLFLVVVYCLGLNGAVHWIMSWSPEQNAYFALKRAKKTHQMKGLSHTVL